MKKNIIISLFLASIPAAWSLLGPGGYEPHDLHHLADIHQMQAALLSGQLPPRLGPDFLFGFGYPLFNFYYVLPFYLGAVFYAITGSLMIGFKLVFLVSIFASVFGMYLLLRKFFGTLAAASGAVLYLYTPFRAVEIYVRGAIGEALAIAIFPLLMYFLACLVEKTTKKNIAKLSIVVALLILSHNYFFLLISPFVLVFIVVLFQSVKDKVNKIKALIFSAILGAGISAFWWFPAFTEYKLVASNTPFNIIDHFPFIKQLLLPSWGYGSSVWGPGDEISFQIGVINLLVVILAIVYFTKQRKFREVSYKISLIALAFFFLSIFMMNVRSLPVWNLIPFTNFIQFPWRLLSLTTFFTAFLAGFVIDNFRSKKISSLLLATSCILLTFNYFQPSKITNKSDEEYLKHFFNNTQYSEDYLQLPNWTTKKPVSAPTSRFFAINADVDETQVSKIHWKAEINAYEETEVYANVLAFPGWAVDVDGEAVETYPGSPYGQLMFTVGEGNHQVELYWEETRLRLIADLISLGSLLVLILLYLRAKAPRATI